jgi:hypothetical protein
MLSDPELPTASSAVIVMLFVTAGVMVIPVQFQFVVPEHGPLPPWSFTHVTRVTPSLSDAVPLNAIGVLLVVYVGLGVGLVIVTVGDVVSPPGGVVSSAV